MRKTDLVFLLCVLICAGLFAARSISRSIPTLSGAMPSGAAALGAAGQPRQVDMAKLERLIEERVLSDHEAEFYEPIGVPSSSGGPRPSEPAAPSKRDMPDQARP
ncbi:MAG: hypothetical protein ACOX1P_10400 [Thermoguttaceae bacterium]|jgi:hypothetical protein